MQLPITITNLYSQLRANQPASYLTSVKFHALCSRCMHTQYSYIGFYKLYTWLLLRYISLMCVVLLFICGNFQCIEEYNNYLQCLLINNFCRIRPPTKIYYKHVKYSCDLIWATYGKRMFHVTFVMLHSMLNIAIFHICVCPQNVQQLVTKRDKRASS